LRRFPGVGLLTATAAVATIGDARVFESERRFATHLGLVPRQTGTGGRVKLLGIGNPGDKGSSQRPVHKFAESVATGDASM
jgi:transposase